jgi:hypothetical protein
MKPSVVVAMLFTSSRVFAAEPSLSPDLGYLCPDGKQVHVMYCRDASMGADCPTIRADLPANNGIQGTVVATRAELIRQLSECEPHAIIRDRGTVRLGPPILPAVASGSRPVISTPRVAEKPAARPATLQQWGEVEYSSSGRISRIGNMDVEYCCGDRLHRVGDMYVEYCCGDIITKIGDFPVETWHDGRLRRVGDMNVEYLGSGDMWYIGNR